MRTFTAQVRGWSEKAKRNADLVLREAAQTTLTQMTRRQPSIKETGTFEIGKVPVDESELIGSQIASINGTEVAQGEVDYSAIIAGLDAGGVIRAVFTADHARPMEYGFTTKSGSQVPGRFFVRSAVQDWPSSVASAARKFQGK